MTNSRNAARTALRFVLCLALLVCALFFGAQSRCAALTEQDLSGYDYYIRNYDVQVTANTDRSYDVTETLDVYFNTASHGIYRNISTSSSAERTVEVRNLRVEGDPYELEGSSSVRIGDADKEITGAHTYVIKYTLWQYADEVPDYDYLYLNVIGTEWDDTPIVNVTATVHLPAAAQVNKITVTGGSYGSRDTDVAAATQTGQDITIKNNRILEPNEGITLNVEMLPGAFPDAEVWVPDLVFHSVDTAAQLDEYGRLTVHTVYDLTINHPSYILYSFYATDYDQDDLRIMKATASLEDGKTYWLDDKLLSVSFYDDKYIGTEQKLTVDYTVGFDVAEDQSALNFDLPLFTSSYDTTVEALHAEVTQPFTLAGAEMDSFYTDGEMADYAVAPSGKTVTVDSKKAFETRATLALKLTDCAFQRDNKFLDWLLPAIAGACLLAALLFAFVVKPSRLLVPAVEFYPPEGMNPAEMGYFIDTKESADDVVSLIYYWASQGYLRIDMPDKHEFTLYKRKEMRADPRRPYEQQLFRQLWACGHGGQVTKADLQDTFYVSVADARRSIRKMYTGVNQLESKGRSAASVAAGCLLPLLIAAASIAAVTIRGFSVFGEVCDLLAVLGLGLSVGLSATKLYQARYRQGWGAARIFSVVWIIARIAMMAFLFVGAFGARALSNLSALVTVLLMAATLVVTPFIRRRTRMGQTLLERCLGFREFLVTAERDKLESMLAQNPDYYYDILPYAQVLGVSDIWKDRFQDITLPPSPSWADVGSGMLFAEAFSSMNGDMRSAMTSQPGSDGGSGGGGGGGGFSGGGFSGGGSGGGGGGRW